MNRPLLFVLLASLFLTSFACQPNKLDEALDAITQAINNHRGEEPFHVTNAFPELEESSCYQIQGKLVHAFYPPNTIAGYKAAVTSSSAMSLLKTDHPASGYLLKEGWVSAGDTILSAAFSRPFIEVELGYYLRETVQEPIQDIAQLKDLILGVVPVIELPDLGFSDQKDWTLANFIVHNAAAKQFISGSPKPLEAMGDVNSLLCVLVKDGVELGQAKANDALGDQWKALQWLINHRIEQGDEIGPQHLLITGSLGQLFPFEAGQYEVSYGELGQLDFVIQ